MADIVELVERRVQAKQAWGGDWFDVPYLEPIHSSDLAAPNIGDATFRYRFGQIMREGQSGYQQYLPLNPNNYYVRIQSRERAVSPDWKSRWHGIFSTRENRFASNVATTGDQLLTAHGLGHLLDRVYFKSAFRLDPSDEYAEVREIKVVPTFNERHQRGFSLTGNRTTAARIVGTDPQYHVFQPAGVAWSAADICQYLRVKHFPQQIPWRFTGQTAPLEDIQELFDLQNQSMWECLNRLIQQKRGLGFRLKVNESVTPNTVEIDVFSLTNEPITYGTKTLPANAKQVKIGLPTSQPEKHLVETIPFKVTEDNRYDKIIVRTQPIKVMATLSFRDENLEAAWTRAERLRYLRGAGAANDPEKNDAARASDDLEDVFRSFRARLDWDWTTGRGDGDAATEYICCVPKPNDDGTLDYETAGEFYNDGKRFERNTFCQKGTEYDTSPIPETTGTYTEREFRPLMVLVYDDVRPERVNGVDIFARGNPTNKWIPVDKVHEVTQGDVPSSHVRPLDQYIGFQIHCSPGHLFAANADWEVGANGKLPFPTDQDYPSLNYRRLLVTGVLTTDERRQYVIEFPQFTEVGRELVIDIPSAEHWIGMPAKTVNGTVVNGTVVGVNQETGELKYLHENNRVLRDDGNKLFTVVAFAKAWYGVHRQAVHIPTAKIRDWFADYAAGGGQLPIDLGQLVTEIRGVAIGSEQVNTVVTGIEIDWQGNGLSYTTGFANGLDFAYFAEEAVGKQRIGGGGGPGNRNNPGFRNPRQAAVNIPNDPVIRGLGGGFANMLELPGMVYHEPRRKKKKINRVGILLEDLTEGSYALVQPICDGHAADSGSSPSSDDDSPAVDCCEPSSTPDRVWERFGCASAGDEIGYSWFEDFYDEFEEACGKYIADRQKCAPCEEPEDDSSDGSGSAGDCTGECVFVGAVSDEQPAAGTTFWVGVDGRYYYWQQAESTCTCECVEPPFPPDFAGDVEFVDCTPAPDPAPVPSVDVGGGTPSMAIDTSDGEGVFTLAAGNLVGVVNLSFGEGDVDAFELSLHGTSFTPTLELEPGDDGRIEHLIRVRHVGDVNVPHAAGLWISTEGTGTVSRAVSYTPGMAPSTPTLGVDDPSLDVTGGAQDFTLTGVNLTDNVFITISGPDAANFEFSVDGGSYTTAQGVVPSGGVVNSTVSVRKTAPAVGTLITASVDCVSDGAVVVSVAVQFDGGPP